MIQQFISCPQMSDMNRVKRTAKYADGLHMFCFSDWCNGPPPSSRFGLHFVMPGQRKS
jgi:hypothetical protein